MSLVCTPGSRPPGERKTSRATGCRLSGCCRCRWRRGGSARCGGAPCGRGLRSGPVADLEMVRIMRSWLSIVSPVPWRARSRRGWLDWRTMRGRSACDRHWPAGARRMHAMPAGLVMMPRGCHGPLASIFAASWVFRITVDQRELQKLAFLGSEESMQLIRWSTWPTPQQNRKHRRRSAGASVHKRSSLPSSSGLLRKVKA